MLGRGAGRKTYSYRCHYSHLLSLLRTRRNVCVRHGEHLQLLGLRKQKDSEGSMTSVQFTERRKEEGRETRTLGTAAWKLTPSIV